MAAIWNDDEQRWTLRIRAGAASTVTVLFVHTDAPTAVVHELALRRNGDDWTGAASATEVGAANAYALRVEGPAGDTGRTRFDPAKALLDPDATAVWFADDHGRADRDAARVAGRTTLGRSPLARLVREPPPQPRVARPEHGDDELIIVEVHVRGATMRAPFVPEELRGTFAGLTHLVEHYRALGVTAIELLPVHQFDPAEGNYWGYMPLAFAALHHAYAAGGDADAEFVAMVDAYHAAGIEVILDVVFNHTTEEDELGPTYSQRGIDDRAYYVVGDDDAYNDDAGCGNVVRAAHPIPGALILESLQRLIDLGVDGFRFDLGSLLARDLDGRVQRDSAMIDEITALAAAQRIRLIVEPWDLASYQVGDAFPGRTWAQWNGPFRDHLRSFLRGEAGFAAAFAAGVRGSLELFGDARRSINFVTAHDGFTLNDLVSYDHKHNAANGHGGADGTDDNRSWNCGWEGDDIPSEVAADVRALRQQQIRNALVALILAAGTPMLVAGDEFAQTQGGNNNPYNQDNETTWLDWERAAANAELTDFVGRLIALRGRHGAGEVELFGVGREPDLGAHSHSLAWRRGDCYVAYNAWWEPLTFVIQADGAWSVALATAVTAPQLADDRSITLAPRSAVVLTRN